MTVLDIGGMAGYYQQSFSGVACVYSSGSICPEFMIKLGKR
jgi:hypothetical protein